MQLEFDNKQAKKRSVKILKQIKIKTEKSQHLTSRYRCPVTTQHQVAQKECKMLATLHYNMCLVFLFSFKGCTANKRHEVTKTRTHIKTVYIEGKLL